MRILAVAASPSDLTPLDLARERRNLEAAWKGQEAVEVVFLKTGGTEGLRRALLESSFHVLHFMGHGEFDGVTGDGSLIFEGEDGLSSPVGGRALAEELKDCPTLRLVVLNACETGRAAEATEPSPFAGVATALVMGGVPAVVAMGRSITDAAAVAFSRLLYERLVAGDPVDAAMTEARLAIYRLREEPEEWATPILFLRSPDGHLFLPRPALERRRAVTLAALLLAVALASLLGMGWLRQHRASEVLRLNHEGVALRDQGRREDARKAFLAALEVDAESAATLANLSLLESESARYEEALAHAQAAVEAAPDEPVYRYNLGNLLAHLDRDEEALESLHLAVGLDPEYAQAFNEIGNIYLRLDRLAEAEQAFRSGLEGDSSLAPLHKNLARVLLTQGQAGAASRSLETALSLCTDPSQEMAEILYWLAAAHVQANQPQAACRRLQELGRIEAVLVEPWAPEAKRLAQQSGCGGVF